MVMPPQRACVAESQVKHRSSNGPPRVQSNGMGDIISSSGVFCNVRMCVNHQGYDSILLSARNTVNQGGTADSDYSSLTESFHSVRDFFCIWQKVYGGAL